MKKSKIIIPALAMIAFSTAASIAGSVAWFTATRQATISAGTYTVVKTNANLECKLFSGVGTTVSGNTTVDLGNNKLTDGSVSHKGKKAYTPNEFGDALTTDTDKREIALDVDLYDSEGAVDSTKVATLAEKLSRGTIATPAGTIYTAVTWDIHFTVSFGALANDIGLYLNTSLNTETNKAFSRFEVSPDSTVQASTAKGFRMAFLPLGTTDERTTGGSSQRATVFADLQEKTTGTGTEAVTNIKYIGSTSDDFLSGTGYVDTENDLIDSKYGAALPTSSTARGTAEARPDFLGYFKYLQGSKLTMKYRVVAWFEGTDPEIHNRDLASEYQAVASTLTFETVALANS